MASTADELFDRIAADDIDGVTGLLEEQPWLATERDDEGVSALLRARYQMDRALVAAVRAHVPELDVFEAAAFGDLDGLSELLAEDPDRVDAWSGDGFTPLHLAAFFGQTDAVRLLVARGAPFDPAGRGCVGGWFDPAGRGWAAGRECAGGRGCAGGRARRRCGWRVGRCAGW